MEIVNTAVKSSIDQLLTLHKNAPNDIEFMGTSFDIIQTLLNNIHIAQSHMFTSLIGGITKHAAISIPEAEYVNPDDKSINKDIDNYMDQFSNISISTKTNNVLPYTVTSPISSPISSRLLSRLPSRLPFDGEYNRHHSYIKGNSGGPIDRWLRERREEDSNYNPHRNRNRYPSDYTNPFTEFDEPEDSHNKTTSEKYNLFNDEESEPYNHSPDMWNENHNPGMWHDKINTDVEQCCARIGKQVFMVDNMEPEFLDNYPPDTYIDENGFVHGRSCLRTIDTKLFNTGQIFCIDHACGYEDIRKQSTTAHTDSITHTESSIKPDRSPSIPVASNLRPNKLPFAADLEFDEDDNIVFAP